MVVVLNGNAGISRRRVKPFSLREKVPEGRMRVRRSEAAGLKEMGKRFEIRIRH
jgi:hypothetical protein